MSDYPPINHEPGKAKEKDDDSRFGWGSAVLAIAVLVGSCLLLHRCHQPPPVRRADAPESQFSAQRALDRLERHLGTGAPHPLGTSENKQVVERLVAELETLGLQPVITEDWVSNEHRIDPDLGDRSSHGDWLREWCRVRNVSAEMASTHPDRLAILLACHHDSVGAGAGAADDGAAVATLLEVARALKEGPPLPRPVILLFTDGEEVGLMGAQGFVDHDPLAERVGMVVNFEARGVTGGSVLFETSENNHWIVRQAAAGLAYPMSSSAYVEIYRMMPNDSDLTVFMDHGMPGMNFAFVGGPRHYHTPGDSLDNLDPRSLQHHGENALGMVRQLLDADWPEEISKGGDAVYTDVFAWRILSWPAAWGPAIGGLVLVILLWSFVRLRRQWKWSGKEIAATTLGWFMVLVIAGLLSCLGFLPRVLMGDTQTPFPVAMHLDMALIYSSAIIGIVLSLLLIRRRPVLLFVIHGLALALPGLALSLTKTGFSYLFLLPAAVAAAGSFLLPGSARSPLHVGVPCLAVAVVTAMAWYPLFFRLPLALGVTFLPGSTIPAALVFGMILAILVLPILPLFLGLSRKVIAAASVIAGLVTVAAVVLAVRSKPFSEEEPQRVTLVHVEQEEQDTAVLLAVPREGSVPSTFTAGMTVIKEPDPRKLIAVPQKLEGDLTAIPTRSTGLSAPTMKVLGRFTASGSHTAHILVKPARDSQRLLIGIPAPAVELGCVKISDRSRLDPAPRQVRADHRWLGIRGAPPEGIELVLSWVGPKDWSLIMAGVNYGLPEELAPVARTRDSLPACPSHEGDRTVILHHAEVGNPDP